MVNYEKIKKLKAVIISISKEMNTNKIIYDINCWFGWPSVAVKIGDIELNQNPKYDFFGWNNGIGELELMELEKEGFLKKISEIVDEQDPSEKTIEYEIVK